MEDKILTLRESQLNEQLRDAWDEGFEQGQEAGEGGEWTNNPYARTECAMNGCLNPRFVVGLLCAIHYEELAARSITRSWLSCHRAPGLSEPKVGG